MVIDTSAIIAILEMEPEADSFARAIEQDPTRLISSATLLECSIVIAARHGEPGLAQLDQLLATAFVQVAPVDAEQAALGRKAWLDFGKGRHPAKLNFGDCFSYALSRSSGEPLLFKGEDFPKTDLRSVLVRE